MANPLFAGQEIYQLIPQRPPICMVDTVWSATQEGAHTGLTIADDNIFLENGCMQTPGLIEHIAQSAAAFAGYSTFLRGEKPKLGYIGEIKKCRVSLLPPLGSVLSTTITLLGEAAGVSLVGAKTTMDGQEVAECQMKIFLKED